ncbi:MAG: curved DNA-binding protein [Arenicella sp.]|jgi:curved DNA-binding protein
MKYKDYYKTLGLKRDANADEIKRSYRKLARKYHPDVSKEEDAEQQFKQVSEAYEVLRDPEKRTAYDQFGSNWKAGQDFRPPPNGRPKSGFDGGGFTGAETADFSDFFENIFGRDNGHASQSYRGARSRGEDVHTKIAIDIADSFLGCKRSISFKQTKIGKDGRPVIEQRKLNVRIPKGVQEGQNIRLAKQGGAAMGQGEAGDLYLEISFKAHAYYSVEGLDVFLKLPVAPWEAALGAKIEAPTPNGPVTLSVPPNSKNSDKLRLRGRGIPAKSPGDLFAVLNIVLPEAKTDDVKKAYQDFSQAAAFNPRKSIGSK